LPDVIVTPQSNRKKNFPGDAVCGSIMIIMRKWDGEHRPTIIFLYQCTIARIFLFLVLLSMMSIRKEENPAMLLGKVSIWINNNALVLHFCGMSMSNEAFFLTLDVSTKRNMDRSTLFLPFFL
jgi:hypothetical protein